MSDDVFVDTNVLVYARDASEPVKQPAAMRWLDRLWRNRRGRVSVQVLNEYFVSVTMKLKPGLSPESAWRDVTDLLAWKPVPVDVAVLAKTRDIQRDYKLSWWDAQIVAAAGIAGCRRLLTEDMQHGQVLAGVRVVNPFMSGAEADEAPAR